MSTGEYKENFSEGAKSNLNTGKKALEKELYEVAFLRAFWTLENLLKAVLLKSGNFVNNVRGDRHHRCLDLFSKIQCLSLVPSSVLNEVESHMMDLLTINVLDNSGSCHMDSPPPLTHKVINDIRYFDAPSYIGEYEAKSKIEKAEKIYDLLTPFI